MHGKGALLSDREWNNEQLLVDLAGLRGRIDELEAEKTAWLERQEALVRSEECFRKIFNHSNDAIFVVDPEEDRILDANFKACEMLGYTCEELLSMPMSALHPGEMPAVLAFARTVHEEGSGWTNELTCLTKTGEKLATEMSASTIELGAGTHMIALIRDISDRKRAEDALRKTNRRMREDLEAAARIQQSLLPSVSPIVRGVKFAWELHPCEELAGDILNIIQLDQDHLAFYILDVSGHGVAAALLSVTLHKVLTPFPNPNSLLTRVHDGGSRIEVVSPPRVAEQLNSLFPMNPVTQQYFTLLYGVLNVRTKEFRYVTAGHCPPIYFSPAGKPFEIVEYGFPVGMFPTAQFEEQVMKMDPGGRLYLYSDGLTEAMNDRNEPFGKDRLVGAIEENRHLPLPESLSDLYERVRAWRGDAPFEDDVSLLAVEIRA